MLYNTWMRGHNIWHHVGHYLFILTTAIGWVVPWITPHYYQAHPIRMRYSMVLQQEMEEGRPVEDTFAEEHFGELLQNACRI